MIIWSRGFLYALSICYLPRARTLHRRGPVGSCLWATICGGSPSASPLVAECAWFCLVSALLGRAFLKTVIGMLWCTSGCVLQTSRLRRRSACWRPVAGITWGGTWRTYAGIVSGGTDSCCVDQSAPVSVGVVTGAIDLVVILLGWPVFGSVDAVLYGLVTTALPRLSTNYVRQQCRQNADDHHYQGQEIAVEISRHERSSDGQSGGHIHRHGTADAALRWPCQTRR